MVLLVVRKGGRAPSPSQVHLLGRTTELNPSAGIFVTLNPAGKNYGGRSKLPENLKQLFRPVAMTVPDTGLICEIELYTGYFSREGPANWHLLAAPPPSW